MSFAWLVFGLWFMYSDKAPGWLYALFIAAWLFDAVETALSKKH